MRASAPIFKSTRSQLYLPMRQTVDIDEGSGLFDMVAYEIDQRGASGEKHRAVGRGFDRPFVTGRLIKTKGVHD
jgi:hypothetical protein